MFQLVRLTSSIIKVLKNYQLLAKADRFNSFSKELTQLRRILRMNRISANCRDLKKISEKPTITIRSIYDVIFKLIMMGTDLNDTFVYLMQLKVIPEYQMSNLRQNVLDLYFIECMIWLCQHSYELKTGNFTSEQLYKKILYILKYIIDGITSFNDSSFRSWTLGLKTTSLLSIISSIIGLLIIWK